MPAMPHRGQRHAPLSEASSSGEGAEARLTLILPVSSLDLLMGILLHLSLQDARSCGLVEAGGLQDVCGVDPVVLATSHDMFLEVGSELILVHGDLQDNGGA